MALVLSASRWRRGVRAPCAHAHTSTLLTKQRVVAAQRNLFGGGAMVLRRFTALFAHAYHRASMRHLVARRHRALTALSLVLCVFLRLPGAPCCAHAQTRGAAHGRAHNIEKRLTGINGVNSPLAALRALHAARVLRHAREKNGFALQRAFALIASPSASVSGVRRGDSSNSVASAQRTLSSGTLAQHLSIFSAHRWHGVQQYLVAGARVINSKRRAAKAAPW